MTQESARLKSVGVIVIGRNEGERLRICLSSVRREVELAIYVDSGSTDDSLSVASTMGCQLVSLDVRLPFTAARARNEGFFQLRQLAPTIRYVQFIDGDCELIPGWLDEAVRFLETHDDVAVACGRRRERSPGSSIYNWLCDVEWNTPIGESKACGGDALMRAAVFERAGGYLADVVAGEEPELCLRLRAAGWRIWRIDRDMTLHDASMTRLVQWWRRAVRTGYGFAQGAYLHRKEAERHFVWETRRAWFIGLLLPLFCLIISFTFIPWGLMAWTIYPVHVLQKIVRGNGTLKTRVRLACFYTLASFPQAWGAILFARDRLSGLRPNLAAYK